ncbi:hypothetical protein CEE37_05485 [candidate division LCP-89 bacterium B3_LCP]|uniref:DUF3566 domain-containing protein n=1 Tax=candidate division LCP-89 bacterium B3_LCP TaxID=2012998 RepID=A0A532V1M9_UNCL8|nr:MAG: hypothetical protein CEE37_05485 [candidate division LCP-89 bacterium B3_LCP]
MTYEIKRFDLLSVFKICFLIYLAAGFLMGLFYSLIIMKMIASFGPLIGNGMFEGIGQVSFIGAIVLAFFMAIFMAVIWSIITVIVAGIYNVLAGFIGGLRLEMDAVPVGYQQTVMPTPPQNPPSNTGESDHV